MLIKLYFFYLDTISKFLVDLFRVSLEVYLHVKADRIYSGAKGGMQKGDIN